VPQRKSKPAAVATVDAGGAGAQTPTILPARLPPTKPKTLPNEAAAVWDEVAPVLFALGKLSQLDTPILENYCRTVARYRRAVAKIEETEGDVVAVNGEPKTNPWTVVASRASAEMLNLARNLGLCPGAPIRMRK
jgi:P27 family predicted phage terminase small subunit